MLQLRNKPTLSPKQLEADKALSSEVLEKQQFRVLLALSCRRDNTGRMLRGKNCPPRGVVKGARNSMTEKSWRNRAIPN